ncbi:hypothetical protein TNIN_463871 [Trichonephila inaurata madagascariensis]|uniref:Uncharacterized protein n=1 Tax=Trichonephila inaurata madagascariensis TaxID=2747483 RepID=A0A8X6Y528_9ARAC|nr:hypothetical protein TNIN_463871 [Trichonephila inaurata madagascariensis]
MMERSFCYYSDNVFEDDQIVPDCSQTLKFPRPSSQGNWTTDLKLFNLSSYGCIANFTLQIIHGGMVFDSLTVNVEMDGHRL